MKPSMRTCGASAIAETPHFLRFDPFTDKYTWKDSQNYRQTDWYLFQEAVKIHQNETWEILAASNLNGLDLEAL